MELAAAIRRRTDLGRVPAADCRVEAAALCSAVFRVENRKERNKGLKCASDFRMGSFCHYK